ncbi:MAG: bifunctional diaminohydroxyphosphoribosylaminopyrimidine deaminase/5-amino-6-(5-phosphoribosylamino)uracil reductase RibD [Gemmatimonadaceae bacterium]|nr:bifunctional diaminohydroxyphosphoribosylaminopyrimidine deaminase/5-amino-6-(5-phosphoribosylamino)uracil reductase RibD [Gemmatimonadaceae bacterium]
MTPAAPRDGALMRRALRLARRGWGQTAPNPMVGAVVVRDGQVVGEGYHARFGDAHAEAVALAQAGERARGADVYVTLEPCNHHGKTPPCADALVAAGVRRVIIAVADPNPEAAGGIDRLKAAGIAVDVGVEAEAAAELNAPFLFSHVRRDRPFVTLKLALSLDGAIAPGDGTQRWLTGEAARKLVHRQRAGADAILVGIGTALTDDPALTVRSGKRPRVAPRRLVLDRDARLPLKGQLARGARKVPVEVLTGETAPSERVEALRDRGVLVQPAASLESHLAGLRERGVRHLYVEGGAGVAGALLSAGYVDRLIIFRAPVLLGAGALAGLGTVVPPAGHGDRWTLVESSPVGDDLVSVYRPAAADSTRDP